MYDYGPTGCAIKANILSAWRQFFVLEEQLLEVDCSMLTPENVLKASGHVERFTDYMVKDAKTGECFRADHLVEAALEAKRAAKGTSEEEKREIDRNISQVMHFFIRICAGPLHFTSPHLFFKLDNFGADELNDLMKKFDVKSPITKNELSAPQKFNLMFSTSIGPTGQYHG